MHYRDCIKWQPLRRMLCVATSMLMACSLVACDNEGTISSSDSGSGAETEEGVVTLEQETGETGTNDSKEEALVRETFVASDFSATTQYYEAEDATLLGGAKVASSASGFSGDGYVDGIANEGDGVSFSITVSASGFYDLNFRSSTTNYKANYVGLDGCRLGELAIDKTNGFEDSIYEHVYLEKGTHEVTYTKYWGYVSVDSLAVSASKVQDFTSDFYEVETELVNPNATKEARNVYQYMTDIYGYKFLSGQYCDGGMYGAEMQTIRNATGGIQNGKYPAVLGLDMIDYSPSRVAYGTSSNAVENAIQWWEAGGIVTFCWHWNAPEKYISGTWYSAFNTAHTDIDLEKIMNGEDQEGYDLLMQDIDVIAEKLLELQDAGVPILWRPLHEASGGWFWWGASGPEAYKKLYILLYDRLVNEYGINNLIWVWNGQDKDWYPGDEYVDIVGMDVYPGEHVYTSQIGSFLNTRDMADGKKMVILSENGCLFDPDLAYRDGAMWGMWGTWGGEFVVFSSQISVLSEKYTEKEMVEKAYRSEYVVTLDELPDFSTYGE